jgi:tripartite-type tricarboxylate transporter receptor subunit TctC
LLVVNPNNPANTGTEFISWVKRQKDGATMASSGTGSVPHLAMELLGDAANVKLTHIPYKGAAPAITDVIAGHVDGFFGDIPGLIGHVKSGRLKAIGLAAQRRHPAFPDIKTFDELGVKGVDSDNWYAIFTTKGTSSSDIDRIDQAVRKTLALDSVKQKLLSSGAEPSASSPAELAALLRADTAKWTKVIIAKKIKPD